MAGHHTRLGLPVAARPRKFPGAADGLSWSLRLQLAGSKSRLDSAKRSDRKGIDLMSSTSTVMENNATGIPTGKLGIWVFLASEVMLFGAFISSYVVLRMGSPHFGVPPEEIMGRPLATFNTFALITSSVTMVLALAAIQRDNIKAFAAYLSTTIGLG